MAGHVSSRESREKPVDAGEVGNPSHHAHTQESDFSYRGKESVPRSLGPLYVSPVPGTRISLEPRNTLHTASAEQFNNDAHLAENYTFGGTERRFSGDAGEKLARAIRAMTLDYMADDLREGNQQLGAYGCHKIEAERDIVNEAPIRKNEGVYLPGPNRVGLHREANTTWRHKPNTPKNTTEFDTEKDMDILPDNNMKLNANISFSEVHSLKPVPIHAGTEETDPSKVTGSFLDEHTLADTAYRKSCFLGLGSWNVGTEQEHATAPAAPIGSLSLSDSSHPMAGNRNPMIITCGSGEPSSSGYRVQGSHSSSEGTKGSGTGQGSGNRKEKRPSGDPNEKDDPDSKRHKSDDTAPKTLGKRFACPFQKHDPAYYCIGKRFRACNGPGFPDISRLKEHLYRTHTNPVVINCARCQLVFSDTEDLRNHVLEKDRCDEQPPKPSRGITPAMKKALQKKTVGVDPEEKWCEIYRLLFCESVPSSPYYDSEDKGDFNHYAERHLPQLVESSLEPLMNDMNATQEQHIQIKDAVATCCRNILELYMSAHDADKHVVPDNGDTDSHLEVVPEMPGSTYEQIDDNWLNYWDQQQPLQHPVNIPEDIFLSNAFPPFQHSPTRRALPVTNGISRPSTSQQGNSFCSDSGVGTSSTCKQCDDGTCERCLGAITPPLRSTHTGLPDSYSSTLQPSAIDPLPPRASHIHDSSPQPSNFASNAENDQYFDETDFQNYCGYEPFLQDT